MKNSFYITLGIALLCSCSSDDNISVPGVDGGSSIGLSDTHVELNCAADTVYVQTEKGGWSVDSVIVEGVSFKMLTDNKDEDGAYAGTFGWLTVKCYDKEIMLATTGNYGKERSFALQLVAGDSIVKLSGKQDEVMEGMWSDVIKPSPRDVVIGSEGGNVCVTTENLWWIYEIEIDSVPYVSSPTELEECAENGVFDKTIEWLTVKRDGKNVFLTIEPNTTDKVRNFKITLGSGDYYCSLNGIQSTVVQ